MNRQTAQNRPKARTKPKAKPTTLVVPLDPKAFQYAIKLIDSAPTVGADAGNVIMLKRELARAAGLKQSQQPG